MNPENAFLLENAQWPALLVDNGGVVLKASTGAKKVFGSLITTKPLAAIWSKENDSPPESFLAQALATPEAPREIRLRARDGNTSSYIAHVCNFEIDRKNAYLVQLLKTATPAEVEEAV